MAGGLLSLNSIAPMGAATAATIVKIGTPSYRTCDFEKTCKRNKRRDLETRRKFPFAHFHYEFDYTIAVKYNARYAKFVEKEAYRLGEDSDEFRMSYRLHWLTERGKFMTDGLFESCCIRVRQEMTETVGRGSRRADKRKSMFIRPSFPTTSDRFSFAQIAAVDFGKSSSSTIVTVGRVWWENPFEMELATGEGQDRFYIHVQNWLELHGDDYAAQIPQIVDFLSNYQVSLVVTDSTGPGDPLTDWLASELAGKDINVEPFVFSMASKDIGYRLLSQEMSAGRITWPAGQRATKLKKWQRFRQQMLDLEKRWRGSRMVVEKPDEKGAHDDYPDSLMLLVWGATTLGEISVEVETNVNPFVGREAKRGLSLYKRYGHNGGERVSLKDRVPWQESTARLVDSGFRRA